ncbi:MAG TPA: ABC transporter permease, partial [Gemmatimonadaceae bacterium]|nr:ABC transporter permease [Gemmatimonadaceae bacterium]
MNRFPGLRRFMRLDRGSASIEHAVDDELQFHFDMTMRDLMSSGMNERDARRETERRFGDLQRTRERLTSIDRSRVGRERRAEWWSAFAQDLRYAVRGLRLSPGFALAVIVTLGLGIGANATMFGIVDRLLFRPPAFLVAPDRAGRVYFGSSYRGTENIGSYTGYQPYLDLRTNTRSFDAMTPFYVPRLAIGAGDVTREMKVGAGDADLWRMFDVKPVIGRFFTAQECAPPNGADVAVLSYAFWQTQFGGRKDAIGARLDIGAAKYTVIGVAPEGFNAFSSQPIVAFIPVAAHAAAEGYGGVKNPWYSTYNMTWLEVFARRKPGVTAAEASADLTHAYQLSYKRS